MSLLKAVQHRMREEGSSDSFTLCVKVSHCRIVHEEGGIAKKDKELFELVLAEYHALAGCGFHPGNF